MDYYSFFEKDILCKLAQRSESQCTQIHTGSGRVEIWTYIFITPKPLFVLYCLDGGNKRKQNK